MSLATLSRLQPLEISTTIIVLDKTRKKTCSSSPQAKSDSLKMALMQFSISAASVRSSPSFPCSPAQQVLSSSSSTTTKDLALSRSCFNAASLKNVKRKSRVFTVRSSLDSVATVGQVTEVNKDNFWPIVNSVPDKIVVVDMYTQWCGPCKVIAPKFQELSKKYLDVVFLKLDCNQENKSLAKELGIRVVPTFKILKNGKIEKEVTGAKLDDLVLAIETVLSS